MPAAADILRELEKLEKLQIELAAIASRSDERRRHDLIDLRRKQAEQHVVLDRVVGPFFADADTAIAREYREAYSRMRSAAAIHQASWPAVSIDEANGAYAQSASGVRDANRHFVAWVRKALQASRR